MCRIIQRRTAASDCRKILRREILSLKFQSATLVTVAITDHAKRTPKESRKQEKQEIFLGRARSIARLAVGEGRDVAVNGGVTGQSKKRDPKNVFVGQARPACQGDGSPLSLTKGRG